MKRADRQKIIGLRFFEGQSWETIASEVGISRPTINKDRVDNADVWFSEIRSFFCQWIKSFGSNILNEAESLRDASDATPENFEAFDGLRYLADEFMYLVEQGRKHFEDKCKEEDIDPTYLSRFSSLRFDTPKRERLRKDREAYKEQIESAKAAGKAEVYQEVAAWDKRRKESEAQGEPFTEPPPTKNQEKSL